MLGDSCRVALYNVTALEEPEIISLKLILLAVEEVEDNRMVEIFEICRIGHL